MSKSGIGTRTRKDYALFVLGGLIDIVMGVMFIFVAMGWNLPGKRISAEFVLAGKSLILTLLGFKGVDKVVKCRGERCDRYPGVYFVVFDGALYVFVYALNFFGYTQNVPDNMFLNFAVSGLMFCSTKGFDLWEYVATKMPLKLLTR